MTKNKISRIGLKMLNWHSGMGDPIYAVGSFMMGGKLNTRETTERACANIGIDIKLYDADPGVYGWTKADRAELGQIHRALCSLLAAKVAPPWLLSPV